jgi:catechol 2,3-dioxygenase-like lactoylglutathione lyase family enzyme
MKPRISVLTLGVADLDRSLAFYRDGLRLPTQGIVGREFEHGAGGTERPRDRRPRSGYGFELRRLGLRQAVLRWHRAGAVRKCVPRRWG